MDFQRAAQERGPLPHPEDSQSGAPRLFPLWNACRIETGAVIADPEPNLAVEAPQVDDDPRRPGVLVGISQRFLRNPIQGGYNRRRQPLTQSIDMQSNFRSGRLLGQWPQRRDK